MRRGGSLIVAVIDRNLNPGHCMAGHDHAQDKVRRYGLQQFYMPICSIDAPGETIDV